jgi:hypothetical protein
MTMTASCLSVREVRSRLLQRVSGVGCGVVW